MIAKSGSLPPGAVVVFVVLIVAVAGTFLLDHLPAAWSLYGIPRVARRARPAQAAEPTPVLPPGPLTPPAEPTGNGQAPTIRRRRPGGTAWEGRSIAYRAYLRGEPPPGIPRGPTPAGPWWDGILWPDRIRPWKAEHRRQGGTCDIAKVLARGGQPNCGWPEPLRVIDTDHVSYDNLFHETRADVVFGCRADHDRREALKHHGLDIYQAWGLPY